VLIDHHPRRGRSQRAVAAQVAAQANKLAPVKNEMVKGGAVKVLSPAKPKKKKWTKAQKMVEEQVFAAMAAKHAKMEAAAKKSALSDYWHNIKTSLSSEKKRLGGFGASEALDRANREMYDDQTQQTNTKLRSRRTRMMQNKLSEMSQEKEMESEDAYKDVQSHKINYSTCDSDCQAARSITTGIGARGGSSNSYFGSSYHDNYMSNSDSYDKSSDDDDFSAGR